MSRMSGTANLFWIDGGMGVFVRRNVNMLLLGLLVLALATFGVLAVNSLSGPSVSLGVAAGLEASTARWSALGAQFSEAGAQAADSARWSALAAHFAPNYELVATTSSARWNALGKAFGVQGRNADSARWVGLAVFAVTIGSRGAGNRHAT